MPWIKASERLPGMNKVVEWMNKDGGDIPLGKNTFLEQYKKVEPNVSWHYWLDESVTTPPPTLQEQAQAYSHKAATRFCEHGELREAFISGHAARDTEVNKLNVENTLMHDALLSLLESGDKQTRDVVFKAMERIEQAEPLPIAGHASRNEEIEQLESSLNLLKEVTIVELRERIKELEEDYGILQHKYVGCIGDKLSLRSKLQVASEDLQEIIAWINNHCSDGLIWRFNDWYNKRVKEGGC